MQISQQTMDVGKHVVDAISVGTVVSTLLGYLPALAALASLIWSVIRIIETDTVQHWLGKK